VKRIAAAFLLPLAWTRLAAVEVKPEGWKFPNPARAEKLSIHPMDATPRIPGDETLVKFYRKEIGVVYETYEIDGAIYACQFHIKGKEGEPPQVYAIVDTDGNGSYETKYGPGEKAPVPEWVIERYYQKHKDQKDPGPPHPPGAASK
jgi:hypothetical protein